MTKTWYVEVPIAGSITIDNIEAANAKEAIAEAWCRINEHTGTPGELGDVAWEFFDEIAEGNVCHAPCNEINATRYME